MHITKALLGSLFAFALTSALASDAHAGDYVDGPVRTNTSSCPATGQIVNVAYSWVSYYADPASGLPSTGDVAYVRAIAWNVSPCLNDAIGFHFNLPQGAQLAVSAQNPVYCWRGNQNGAEPVPNSSNSACYQTPQYSANGMLFGFQALPPGWFLDIRVPVTYTKAHQPFAPQNKLRVVTSSAYGNINPEVAIPVGYRPSFGKLQYDSWTLPATVSFLVDHYAEVGTVEIQTSSDPSFSTGVATSSKAQSLDPSALRQAFTIAIGRERGFESKYWRVRMQTAWGTHVSAAQRFR